MSEIVYFEIPNKTFYDFKNEDSDFVLENVFSLTKWLKNPYNTRKKRYYVTLQLQQKKDFRLGISKTLVDKILLLKNNNKSKRFISNSLELPLSLIDLVFFYYDLQRTK